MKTPEPLTIDPDSFSLQCIDDGPEFHPYVDVRLDTIPALDGDPDFSESPEFLRKAAAWLVNAADWLERRQRT